MDHIGHMPNAHPAPSINRVTETAPHHVFTGLIDHSRTCHGPAVFLELALMLPGWRDAVHRIAGPVAISDFNKDA